MVYKYVISIQHVSLKIIVRRDFAKNITTTTAAGIAIISFAWHTQQQQHNAFVWCVCLAKKLIIIFNQEIFD